MAEYRVTIKDISERLRKEEEVREANERFNYVPNLLMMVSGSWPETQKGMVEENLHAIPNYPPPVLSNFWIFETLIHPEDKEIIKKLEWGNPVCW